MTPSKEIIRLQVKKLLESDVFIKSECLGRFLQFTVEHTLEKKQSPLKEYLIGVEVYRRRPSYDPSRDSIVRTEALRLRSKLKEYYENQGRGDPVLIYYRPGSYVPIFRVNLDSASDLGQGAEGQVSPAINIAILPFRSISEGAASVAAGLTNEVRHLLLQTPGVRVKTSEPTSPETGVDDVSAGMDWRMNVEWILDGTVQISAGRAKITARIATVNGLEVTSQQFEIVLSPESIFQMQERIAQALISRIAPQCSNVRRYLLPPGSSVIPPEGSRYYADLLAAEDFLDRSNPADLIHAVGRLKTLTNIFPECARAQSGLSQAYLRVAVNGGEGSSKLVTLGRIKALEAVRLAPAMMGAHAALGTAFAMEWNWTKAEESFRKAIRCRVNQTAYRQFGLFQTVLGRFDEGGEYLMRGNEIDPFSYVQKVSMVRYYLQSRRFEEGLQFIEQLPLMGEIPVEVRIFEAFLCTATGNLTNAVAIAKALQRSASVVPSLICSVVEILALAGDHSAAQKLASEYELSDQTKPLTRVRRAFLACAFGHHGQALDLLKEAVHAHEAELLWVPTDPRLDSIAHAASFVEVLRLMRYPETARPLRGAPHSGTPALRSGDNPPLSDPHASFGRNESESLTVASIPASVM